jgi:hypothetical protein
VCMYVCVCVCLSVDDGVCVCVCVCGRENREMGREMVWVDGRTCTSTEEQGRPALSALETPSSSADCSIKLITTVPEVMDKTTGTFPS